MSLPRIIIEVVLVAVIFGLTEYYYPGYSWVLAGVIVFMIILVGLIGMMFDRLTKGELHKEDEDEEEPEEEY